jgi:hypothetical protein
VIHRCFENSCAGRSEALIDAKGNVYGGGVRRKVLERHIRTAK